MGLNLIAVVLAVVAFKDAAKIRSWDAWDDHKAPVAWNEKPCVTREKLLKMDPGLEPWGWLETRGAKDIKSSWWSVGCETLDRDYADWDQYKFLLAGLGVKHARFFSGWAKTEQEKGKYDFTWLDPQIRECAAMGVKPWVCISYGNPVWGSDFRLGMRVKQVTDNPEAFAAWIRYVKALVTRYKDVVDEWEIWNEPFDQDEEYATLYLETAKAVRSVQPAAKLFCTAVGFPKGYVAVIEKLRAANAPDLVDRFICHPYVPNPDATYEKGDGPCVWQPALRLRELVKTYSPRYDILQGEVGCPSQLEFAHALANIEWTEYAQAKWDLRRAIGDRVRDIPSNLFTFIDLQYTFMLQSFGLVRSNTLKEPVYRRPSYFAMQNVYSYFDDNVYPVGVEKREVETTGGGRKELTVAKFERRGTPIHVVWFSGERPGDSLVYERADLSFIRDRDRLAWVDLMTGRICRLPDVKSVPVWDSPVMIVPTWEVERRIVWSEMTPAEIVDSVYRPYEGLSPSWINGVNIKMDVSQEPWTKMKTEEFLPCFDRYGQFKWREWPGKTHSDEELKASAADEERDLAAHPGPDGRDAFGGRATGSKRKATGRFRTEKIGGTWWLVDPEGNLFWSWGPVRVTPSSAMTPLNGVQRSNSMGGGCPDRDCLFEDLPAKGTPLAAFYDTYDALLLPFYLKRGETRRYDFSAANLFRKFGADWFERYSDLCHRRLRSWGCNTIANSSDLRICLQDRTPYAERVECESRTIEGSWGQWSKFRDPFDPSFTAGVTEVLKAHGREAHDKWCIGFFIDNEINWGWTDTMLAEWTLRSPEDQPARIEFVKRLKAKGIDPLRDKVPAEELRAFTAALTEEYFRKTRETVKAFDPDLLYLGCRFAGSRAPAWAIGPCVKHCDVVSYNIYAEEVGSWRLPEGLDAPVLIGEFHFGAHDRGLFGSGLCNAGDQRGRAAALRTYVESALRNPQVVGAHWHQFSDQATSGRFDGEYFQVGWTDICDRPYVETVEALRALDIYAERGVKADDRARNVALTDDWLNVEYEGGGWDRAAGLHVAIDGREEFVLECTIGGEPRHWAALDVRNFRGKTAKVEMRAPGTWERGTLCAVESAATPREGALKFCPRSQCRALDVVLPRPADGRFLLVPVRRQAPPVTCDFWDGTNLLFDLRVRLAVDGEPDYLASVPLEDFAADTVRCSTDDPVVPAADYAACVRRFAVAARPSSVTTPTDGTFAAPYGGTGDMVGFFRLNGRYHIGFLHDYAGDIWNENCCWSHASSDDLVHWRMEKPFDRKGKGVKRSSGCCFVDGTNRSGLGDGRTPPVLLFGCIESGIAQRYQIKSGTARQTRPDLIPTLTMKYSRDGGKTFVDHPKPILRMQDIGGHDPEIIYHRQSDSFVMVLHDRRDGAWGFDFYTSTNLLDWTYASTVKGLWETPNFFPLAVEETGEEKWVLMQCDLRYYVGSFDGRVFTPETPLRPPLFAGSFAPRTVQADDGRRILMAARLGANGATRPVVLCLRSENGQLQISYNPLNT